ncbi:KAP P-loop domain protein [Sulfuricurvum kujiense DSM 16994]|uniref:KAP P-loop domain protein n=1 Tax=Sulfuricurvum kujiense (strain ATCC BAA-921 / DSM 16994 / JCM 11577 / YK-1) TaxID=709032 RepID=E4TY12_SULKY|nr:kap p-loop domain-containing protein [Sulfuricurvum kujiense]ADR32925.1 KAP P-loop domain protein [Sulfuricurvum kujiense DSM 16994]
MTQNTAVNHHIKDFLEYYIALDQPEYAVLLSGKWGSGKTFFINQVTEKYQDSKNIVKVSLFGLKSKEDIHKKVLLKLFNIDDTHDVSVTARVVGQVLKKFTGINLSDMPMGWALKQEGNQNAIFIFDDLERTGIELLELHGYINELTETHKQKVILLADEDKLKDDEKYILFKEKTIGKTFQIEQDFDTVFSSFLNGLKHSKEILQNNQSVIKSVYETAGYNNLRSLRQGLLDFDRLINYFEPKFKNHAELMTEIIQNFFVFTFEIKSGKLDIQTLQEMTMLRVGRMLNEEKSDDKLTPIEKVFHKYSFLSYELLLSMESWIDFFTLGILASERITDDLNRSRYFFREEREEWLNLWYFRELEEEEFQIALKSTLDKLERNEYSDAEIVMHITGILLRLSANRLYQNTEADIVQTMKEYIDRNRKNWDDIYTVDDFRIEQSGFGLGYQNEEMDEFKEVKNYLLEKAKETMYEDLSAQGERLLKYLEENNISMFMEMLSETRNDILYRLPVFQNLNPEDFVETLYHVKNQHFRSVVKTLLIRYDQVGWGVYFPLLEELDFWKSVCQIIRGEIEDKPINIKVTWLKYLNESIEEKIIRKIEKQMQHIEKEKNNVE